MITVIGIVHSVGDYNGVKYDNYNLHCTVEPTANNNNVEGLLTDVIKIKASTFMASGIGIGDTIDVSYDKFGRIKDICKF